MPNALFSQLFILLAIAAVGYLCRRTGLYPEETQQQTSTIILNIALPAGIVAASRMEMRTEDLIRLAQVAGFSAAYYTVGFYLIYRFFHALPRFSQDERLVMTISLTFPNIAFMGFPLITALLGQEALFYAAIMTLFFNTALFTAGEKLFRGTTTSLRTVLLRPANIATAVMLLLFGFQIRLPQVLHDALSMLGSLSTPLSMLIVGALIAESPLSILIRDWRCWLLSLLRLLVVPLLLFGILLLLRFDPFVIWLCSILSTMPSAAMSAILAERYNRDPQLASAAVVHSMLLFIPAIYLIMELLQRFVPYAF
ncbi:MAG: AEC family transporter [Bacillota bacterium]|nr:AEC family transporter [Bacillota bacterium]